MKDKFVGKKFGWPNGNYYRISIVVIVRRLVLLEIVCLTRFSTIPMCTLAHSILNFDAVIALKIG